MITPLENFKNRLRGEGFAIIVKWEMENDQFMIESCQIKNGDYYITVHFQINKDNFGFEVFSPLAGFRMVDLQKQITELLQP